MSKVRNLKEQYSDYSLTLIDLISFIFPIKYVEMVLNILTEKMKNGEQHEWTLSLYRELSEGWGLDKEYVNNMSLSKIYEVHRILDSHFPRNEFLQLKRFVDLNERKLINNNDLRSYKSFENISMEVAAAELKFLDKSLEKCIVNLFEDQEWIVLRPLTWMSAKKYGANTKWCVSSQTDSSYFTNYTRDGILVFAINKLTGRKIAGHKRLTNHFSEISFWDAQDRRLDSMQCDLPQNIMVLFKKEFDSNIPNFQLLSTEEQINEFEMLERFNKGIEVPNFFDNNINDLRVVEDNQEIDRLLRVWDVNETNTTTTNQTNFT